MQDAAAENLTLDKTILCH